MKKMAVLSVLLLVLGFAGAAQASYTLIYSYTDFLKYCKNPIVENFEDTTLVSGLSITETGGDGSIHDGVYENIVDTDPLRYQTFSYAGGLYGFGAWVDTANPGGPGIGIDVYDGANLVLTIPDTAAGQFYGFWSTTPVYAVDFKGGSGSGSQETYYAVDLALCPVPVPPSALLLGSCLVGLVGFRLRRK